jgi:hypothetical protein
VRHLFRMAKNCVVCFLSPRRTAKVFAGQKCTMRPLSCAWAKGARQRRCRAYYGLCCASSAHDKAHESGSVSKRIVATLTSNMCCDWSLDGRCKATRGHEFILVPVAGPYVQQGCAHGVVLQCTVILIEGGYKRGGRRGEASKSLVDDWGEC